ncbi:MAG: (Fe-S)-binding protein [Candidatus Thermoplasmatota archaeon]|nr:(Fe-S)-binding protein [Candidatus Thermoplasmatota archaeon]MCL5731020.1 (Fe-S)-binding protein [Candidatus Thermoplasmatota archaeon]
MQLFSALLIAGLAISAASFIYTLYSIFWNAVKIPEKPYRIKASIGRRAYITIRNVLLQGKLFKERSGGIMHALMFWGFIAFGAYSATFFARGIDPSFQLIPPGEIKNVIFLTVDVFALVVLIDVFYAFLRRWVIKIPRYQGYNGFEAAFILFLIATLMITYYALGILRIDGVSRNIPGAIMESIPSSYTPVTVFFAGLFPKATGPLSVDLYWTLYTIHALDFLIFLVYIPRSKHLHLVAAPLNVILSKDRQPAQLSTIDFDHETRFGATDIRDFSWKDYLDFYSCTECGRCTFNCPAYLTGKTLSPRDIIWDLREVVLAEGPELRSKGMDHKDQILKPVIGDTISETDLWSCTTCMACVEQCPVMIDHVDKIVNMRRSLVLNQGKAPKGTLETYNNMEMYGSPWVADPSTRGDWAKDLGVNILSESGNDDFEILYWVGCVSSYDRRNQEIAKSVVKILQKAGIKFAILGSEEKCTGDPAKRTGNEYLAENLARVNIDTLNKHKVHRVITGCPHCFNSLKNDYSEMGFKAEVIHHTEFINQLISSGKISIAATQNDKEEKFTYHDSCYLGRYNKIYEPPREIIGHVSDNYEEMSMNKSKGLCCGAGGGRLWMDETVGTKISHKRIGMASDINASTVVTACPYCMIMLDDARRVTGLEDKMKLSDISEFVASRLTD